MKTGLDKPLIDEVKIAMMTTRRPAGHRESRATASHSRQDSVTHGAGDGGAEIPNVHDVNAIIGGYLRDLAFAQASQQKMFGYKRAAAAILALDLPLTDLVGPDGALPRIAGIGPGSTRVIREILDTGESPTVEQAIDGAAAAPTSSGGASFGDTSSAAPKSGASSRIPRFRVPRCSSTAATCKCTPNGATAIRRYRR